MNGKKVSTGFVRDLQFIKKQSQPDVLKVYIELVLVWMDAERKMLGLAKKRTHHFFFFLDKKIKKVRRFEKIFFITSS